MGKVLEFQKTSRPIPAQQEAGRDADILIFPGVRYQRRSAEEKALAKAADEALILASGDSDRDG